jgi:hypothetical protein
MSLHVIDLVVIAIYFVGIGSIGIYAPAPDSVGRV